MTGLKHLTSSNLALASTVWTYVSWQIGSVSLPETSHFILPKVMLALCNTTFGKIITLYNPKKGNTEVFANSFRSLF